MTVAGPRLPSTAYRIAYRGDLEWPLPAPVSPAARSAESLPDHAPQAVFFAPQIRMLRPALLPVSHRFELLPIGPSRVRRRAGRGFWKALPRLARLAIVALVATLTLGLVVWNTGFADSMRESLRTRAAIELDEDFASGLARWGGAARAWSRDPTGFVRTGPLALFRPSLRMQDYRLEFLGQLERQGVKGQSLAWVYRAKDPQNYYVMKLTVVEPGPLPRMALVRYGVIAGREEQRVQVPLLVRLRNDTPYRIQLNVKGTDFTTFIEGQIVDFWSDNRLEAGGVGFFSESSDKNDWARLFWVKVSHQDDLLGKLCAYLAPNDLETRNGSWK